MPLNLLHYRKGKKFSIHQICFMNQMNVPCAPKLNQLIFLNCLVLQTMSLQSFFVQNLMSYKLAHSYLPISFRRICKKLKLNAHRQTQRLQVHRVRTFLLNFNKNQNIKKSATLCFNVFSYYAITVVR